MMGVSDAAADWVQRLPQAVTSMTHHGEQQKKNWADGAARSLSSSQLLAEKQSENADF